MGLSSFRVAQFVARFTSERVVATLALGFCLTACERMVVLGSDCPNHAGPCNESNGQLGWEEEQPDGGPVRDGGPLKFGDAAAALPSGRDASTTPADAGTLLEVGNASFEVTTKDIVTTLVGDPLGVSVGVDVYINNALPLPVVSDLLFSRVVPWYACGTGTWAVERSGSGADEEVPSDGSWFARMPRTGIEGKSTGLFQNVNGGLAAGRSYSFQIDALAKPEEGATVALRLGATNTPCSSDLGTTSAVSEPLDRTWRTLCLTIRPQEALKALYIVPQISGGGSLTTLSFDNLRSVPSCP